MSFKLSHIFHNLHEIGNVFYYIVFTILTILIGLLCCCCSRYQDAQQRRDQDQEDAYVSNLPPDSYINMSYGSSVYHPRPSTHHSHNQSTNTVEPVDTSRLYALPSPPNPRYTTYPNTSNRPKAFQKTSRPHKFSKSIEELGDVL